MVSAGVSGQCRWQRGQQTVYRLQCSAAGDSCGGDGSKGDGCPAGCSGSSGGTYLEAKYGCGGCAAAMGSMGGGRGSSSRIAASLPLVRFRESLPGGCSRGGSRGTEWLLPAKNVILLHPTTSQEYSKIASVHHSQESVQLTVPHQDLVLPLLLLQLCCARLVNISRALSKGIQAWERPRHCSRRPFKYVEATYCTVATCLCVFLALVERDDWLHVEGAVCHQHRSAAPPDRLHRSQGSSWLLAKLCVNARQQEQNKISEASPYACPCALLPVRNVCPHSLCSFSRRLPPSDQTCYIGSRRKAHVAHIKYG